MKVRKRRSAAKAAFKRKRHQRHRGHWLIAGAVILGACGSQTTVSQVGSGELSAGTTASEQGEADPSPASQIIERADGPLRWEPEPLTPAGAELDLCNDEQATEAGLDGGDLENDRRAIVLDCETGAGLRFAVRTADGEIAFGTSASQARSAADELEGLEGSEGFEQEVAEGVVLGYLGPRLATEEALARAEFSVLEDSLSVQDGVLFGLLVNGSGDTFYSDVVVESKFGNSTALPFAVQPYEAVPFSIVEWGAKSVPTTSELSVSATAESSIDHTRAILITGAPGIWAGPSEQLPGSARTLVNVRSGEDVVYFGTGLDAVESSTHTGVRAEGLQPNDVGVIVAFLDIEGRVIGQHTPSIDIQTDRPVGSERVTIGFTGFLVPDNAADFAIWAGGE